MEIAAQQNTQMVSQEPTEILDLNPEQFEESALSKEALQMGMVKTEIFYLSQRGFLFTEGKYYNLSLKLSHHSQKVINYLEKSSSNNQTKEMRNLNPKESHHTSSFKETAIKEKSLTLHKTETKEKQETNLTRPNEKTIEKTKEFVQQKISESNPLPTKIFSQHNSSKRELPYSHSPLHRPIEKTKEKETERVREKPQFGKKENEKTDINRNLTEKNREKEKEKNQQGGQQDPQKDNQDQEPQKKDDKVKEVGKSLEKDFIDYANQDSIVSDLLMMKVSQFDVLLLFIEILKLAVRSKEQERIARWQERELQLLHLEKVVKNFKQQGTYQLMAGIGSGIFAIVSGLCPIAGHLKGDWIKDKLSYVAKSMKDIETAKLFKSLTKMTYAMSEMQKSTGQIQNTFAEGSRTYSQHISELHKTDGDENTRSIEEIKDHWKNMENFVNQSLQMYHESIRQLYS